jgi:3D (Asp-Asp-Asp) domain-containing protein
MLLQAGSSVTTAASRSVTALGQQTLRALTLEMPAVPAGRTQHVLAHNDMAARARPQPSLKYLGTFLVTCYDLTGPTATGAPAGPTSVAVDPGVIPLGTQIYIGGIGFRTADDTGGAIVGYHIDVWQPSYWQCADWGAQERPVYEVSPS